MVGCSDSDSRRFSSFGGPAGGSSGEGTMICRGRQLGHCGGYYDLVALLSNCTVLCTDLREVDFFNRFRRLCPTLRTRYKSTQYLFIMRGNFSLVGYKNHSAARALVARRSGSGCLHAGIAESKITRTRTLLQNIGKPVLALEEFVMFGYLARPEIHINHLAVLRGYVSSAVFV